MGREKRAVVVDKYTVFLFMLIASMNLWSARNTKYWTVAAHTVKWEYRMRIDANTLPALLIAAVVFQACKRLMRRENGYAFNDHPGSVASQYRHNGSFWISDFRLIWVKHLWSVILMLIAVGQLCSLVKFFCFREKKANIYKMLGLDVWASEGQQGWL